VGTRGGKLLQRRIDSATPAAVDTRATVRAAGYPSTIYWPVSSMRVPVPQYETLPVHWDCSACGWMNDSV
jgi:hypothetical protein